MNENQLKQKAVITGVLSIPFFVVAFLPLYMPVLLRQSMALIGCCILKFSLKYFYEYMKEKNGDKRFDDPLGRDYEISMRQKTDGKTQRHSD